MRKTNGGREKIRKEKSCRVVVKRRSRAGHESSGERDELNRIVQGKAQFSKKRAGSGVFTDKTHERVQLFLLLGRGGKGVTFALQAAEGESRGYEKFGGEMIEPKEVVVTNEPQRTEGINGGRREIVLLKGEGRGRTREQG